MSVTDLAVGIAAEHIVCADLLLAGHRAFRADQTCPYDVAVECAGQLVRLQVKATRAPRAIPQRRGHIAAYMWHVRRAGKGGLREYGAGEFDILALVAVDSRRIAYLPVGGLLRTVHIRPHDDSGPRGGNGGGRSGKTFDMYPFASALGALGR